MPSENQGGSQRQRQRFERIQNDIGEDPARWLDWEFVRHPSRRNIALDLIDSIDSIERIRAWKAVERALAVEHGREPRSKIMQRLDQREQWLTLHGERPDRLDERAEPRDLPPVETEFPDRDDVDEAADRATFHAERIFGPLRERYPHLFDDGDNAAESTETAVAADGGDDA
ncbi:hypothetical protein ACAH01_08945 [Halomicrobium sp. HM KBTZ05]|uniref:hypothetical protein n=1 Tax=Halomicrobium sp. HM KBTZ05 TaxID=3242663 RepID=UPI003557FAF5